jgi:hypothetical protein
MQLTDPLAEFRDHWLPHVTDSGLARLTRLVASCSPLLIHGAFTRAIPMGCLASHIAWNHPATEHLSEEAGICWLTRIAHLNPATSSMIQYWDNSGIYDFELRSQLLELLNQESTRRANLLDSLSQIEPEVHYC